MSGARTGAGQREPPVRADHRAADSEILAIYAPTIAYPLYLADYPLGHIIAFQLGERVRGAAFGAGFERIARAGRLTPDAWMRGAVGSPISTAPLLAAARHALTASTPESPAAPQARALRRET